MRFPSHEQVQHLREIYPAGTRIRLIHMDDTQAPPDGATGTVLAVDDAGQLLMRWDTGGSLSLVPDVDRFTKI